MRYVAVQFGSILACEIVAVERPCQLELSHFVHKEKDLLYFVAVIVANRMCARRRGRGRR